MAGVNWEYACIRTPERVFNLFEQRRDTDCARRNTYEGGNMALIVRFFGGDGKPDR